MIVRLCLMLVLLPGLSFVAHGATAPQPIEILVREFVEAFNTGEHAVMTSFYENHTSTSFQERRTEQEDIALHGQLLEMLGNVSVLRIESDSPETARLMHGDSEHASSDPFAFLESAEGVHQSQVFVQADGSLLLVWVQKGPHSLDLFAARQADDGKFSSPTRLNLRGLNRYTGDEARPSVALGPDGKLAIAWTAVNNDIMLATGDNYGTTFSPPLKLNQDAGEAYRTMPAAGMTSDGTAHIVWLDPREAPKGREEPSDLFYASVKYGVVKESNLTARQESTVCGCCRPFIAIDAAGQFDIAFRNSTPEGFRDISLIVGKSGTFGEPQPTSPPIWKLGGCPSAGPWVNDEGTLWKDASTGSWRLLWSADASATPEVLLADVADLVWTHSPRRVSGRDSWVLVGARPHGVILARSKGSWTVVRDDLPPWASSAAVKGGQLILIGNDAGQLHTLIVPL